MEENKRTFKMPLIVVAIIILLIIGVIIYINNSNNPKNVFIGAINSFLDSAEIEQKNVKTANAELGLGININSKNAQIAKVAEYINKTKINIKTQADLEQEKVFVKLGFDYNNESVVDAKLAYKNQEDNIYAKVEELFDKVFSAKIDEETKEQFKLLFEELKNMTVKENVYSKKAQKIMKETISDNLKDEYFTQEDVKLDINGENVKAKKSVLTLTDVQIVDIMKAISNDLKNNEEFMSCFEEEGKQEIEKSLNELEKAISEFDSDIIEATFMFNIYTKGINKQFVKFDLVIKDQKSEVVLSVTKNGAEGYEFLVTNKYLSAAIGKTEEQEVLSGMIMVKEVNKNTNDYVIVFNIDEIGEITVNLQVSYIINEEIENIDTLNSVNVEELTEMDQQTIMVNLQNMKIYKIIQDIISAYSSSMYNDYGY